MSTVGSAEWTEVLAVSVIALIALIAVKCALIAATTAHAARREVDRTIRRSISERGSPTQPRSLAAHESDTTAELRQLRERLTKLEEDSSIPDDDISRLEARHAILHDQLIALDDRLESRRIDGQSVGSRISGVLEHGGGP